MSTCVLLVCVYVCMCVCVCVHVRVACAPSHHPGLAVLIYLSFLFTPFPLSSSVAAWKCSTCGESLSARPHQTHGTGSGPAYRLGSEELLFTLFYLRLPLVHQWHVLLRTLSALLSTTTQRWVETEYRINHAAMWVRQSLDIKMEDMPAPLK